MVDNGNIFEGPHWRFTNSPLQGLYSRSTVYSSVRGLSCFEPWLGRIVNFPEEVVDRALKQIRSSWLEGDEGHFDQVLERLLRRRSRVPELIEASLDAESDPFPNWKPSSRGRGMAVENRRLF
jgi:hypothetical protein